MSDSKTDSKATGGVATSTAPKRDESRGRDRGADSSSRDRRPGNSRGGGHSARCVFWGPLLDFLLVMDF